MARPLSINSDLFGMIPSSLSHKSAAGADSVLGERNSRQFIILSESGDFLRAKEGAAKLYAAISGHDGFESLFLDADENFLSRFRQYLYDYRFMLLDRESREELEHGGEEDFASFALSLAYGAFTLTPLDFLEGDPFLLTERSMENILSSQLLASGRMSVKDDVLAARHNDKWYVMLRGNFDANALSFTGGKGIVHEIYRQSSALEAEFGDVKFFHSGIPFHSYESSSGAQKEISRITTISMIIILSMFIFVFRSPVPVFASFATAGLSILSAFIASLLIFREVHILSFVFGTTLIGTCVDYSVHFFIYRKEFLKFPAAGADRETIKRVSAEAGMLARSRILRGIALCFASTAVCFAALLFAPFSILKQFAVFLLFGLSSSFLTVICLFPIINAGTSKNSIALPAVLQKIRGVLFKKIRFAVLCCSLAVFAILLFVNRDGIKIQNSLGDLYSMPEKLLLSEKTAAEVLDYGQSGWYFIVSGADSEELLQNEEEFRIALDKLILDGKLRSYMSVSSFFPSVRTQSQSYAAAKKLLPLADMQYENLGFDTSAADEYRKEFALSEEKFLLPAEGNFPMELISNLWIGKTGEKYYSCVLPLYAGSEEIFRNIAGEYDNVFFVNKIIDTQTELDRLTRVMLLLFGAALAIVAVVYLFFFTWKQALRIYLVPVFLLLSVLAVLTLCKIPLGFFPLVGILLVFGLGLDYIIYRTEAENRAESGGPARLAVFLSFATSALSFGALALSSFAPVHIFGVTVFSGLCAAYIFSSLLSSSGSDNQRNSGSDTNRLPDSEKQEAEQPEK